MRSDSRLAVRGLWWPLTPQIHRFASVIRAASNTASASLSCSSAAESAAGPLVPRAAAVLSEADGQQLQHRIAGLIRCCAAAGLGGGGGRSWGLGGQR